MMSLFPLGAGHVETSEMRSRSKFNIKHFMQHWVFKKRFKGTEILPLFSAVSPFFNAPCHSVVSSGLIG